MTTLTTNNRKWLFVPVPDGSTGFRIKNQTLQYELYGWGGWGTFNVELPNYRVHATTSDITEAQMKECGFTYNDLAEHSITGRHAIIEII